MQNILSNIARIVCIATISACSTTYKIHSSPDGATVSHIQGGQKNLLGTTPLDFKKSGLPSDTPFVLQFEKQGFQSVEVAVTPTDNAMTTVNASLKQADKLANDENSLRLRAAVRKIFAIQEQVYAQKYVDALASLRELEATEPLLPELHVLKGSVYYLIKDNNGARSSWKKAIELDPSLDDVRVRLNKLEASASQGGQP